MQELSFGIIDIIVFFLFLGAVLAVGLYFLRICGHKKSPKPLEFRALIVAARAGVEPATK